MPILKIWIVDLVLAVTVVYRSSVGGVHLGGWKGLAELEVVGIWPPRSLPG